MKIENIKPGDVFKNYKELCEALEIEPTGGNKKKANLKELLTLADYDTAGREFIIKTIYEKPMFILFTDEGDKSPTKFSQDERGYKFTPYVTSVLLRYLIHESEGETAYLNRTKLYQFLGLFNENMNILEKEKAFKTSSDITHEEFSFIKNQAYSKANEIVNNALVSLRNQRLVYDNTIVLITELSGTEREATTDEIREIMKIERGILDNLHLSSINQVYTSGTAVANSYNRQYRKKLAEHGWAYAQKKIKMIFTRERIVQEISAERALLDKLQLNSNFCDSLTDKMKKQHRHKHLAFGTAPVEQIGTGLYLRTFEDCMNLHAAVIDEFIRYVSDAYAE